MAAIPASLLEHLVASLQANKRLRTPEERVFELHVVRSKSHRSHALFPWADEVAGQRVDAQEVLLTCAEAGIPVFGLEASIYAILPSRVALVYISKVDTTGLLGGKEHPSPVAALTAAFLSHALAHPPAHCTSVRVHVFARAQDQYLFPGSIKNQGKKRLTDKELCRWWKRVFNQVSAVPGVPDLKRFYLLPGFDYDESLPYVPRDAAGPIWTYGHPYTALKPCTGGESALATLNNLIPAFADDPKSRFLMNLTSSPVMPTGESGDYDDAFSNAAGHALAAEELQAGIQLERSRLVKVEGGAEEFWVRMGARQECMDGHLTAFFVVASDFAAAPPAPPALPTLERTSYVRLWSELHNFEYDRLDNAKAKYAEWRTDVETTCKNDGADVGLSRVDVKTDKATGPIKRPAEEAPPAQPAVVTLQPRKKVKKTNA